MSFVPFTGHDIRNVLADTMKTEGKPPTIASKPVPLSTPMAVLRYGEPLHVASVTGERLLLYPRAPFIQECQSPALEAELAKDLEVVVEFASMAAYSAKP